jgi:glutamine synthetase
MVRVPLYKPGKENATRVELRNPDPACNPYLAFAAMLAAGLKGIEEGYELPPEASDNIYEMTEAERAKAGIDSLPEDLYQAIKCFDESEFVREALGDHVCDYLIRNKWAEWNEYKALVTPYEVDRYLPVL